MAIDRQLRTVDQAIWRACAGSSVHIPAVGSRVYYFPQGHAEQSFSTPSFSPLVHSHPFTVCRVVNVCFAANSETDEVFVKMRLAPITTDNGNQGKMIQNEQQGDVEDGNEVVSFSKILTPSDANNGGGFSVPRFCADSIFPPLNFEADPPVQNLGVRDVHGVVWEFRHIYRGTPRRHLLTTGWSKFVNSKKLVAGDSVVFMRKCCTGEIFAGVRRAVKANADCNGRWSYYEHRREEGSPKNVRGRIAAEAVEEAAEMAAKGIEFEVLYYPSAGSADFVVKAEKVEGSYPAFWTMGMRVKMAVETEDSSRMTWFQGTVSSAGLPSNGPWRGSPWRMLQVTWDEPEALQNVKRVSPWQVESATATQLLHAEFHPTKKCRLSQEPGLLTEGDAEHLFPMTNLSHSLMGHFSPSWMKYNPLPASIQGARQVETSVSGVSNVIRENSHQTNSCLVDNISPMAETVSTELNIGSSQWDNLSPDSQSSVHFLGNNEQVGRPRVCNLSPKVGTRSIRLFGKRIHAANPVEREADDVRCTEDGSEVYKETGVDDPLKRSLTYPFTDSIGEDFFCG